MNPARHDNAPTRRRAFAAALVALALIVAAALAPAIASALAGGATAKAVAPAYDTTTLELAGSGAYRNPAPHAALRVEVCLRHRVGGRFFDVRCVPASAGAEKKVTAVATVPGCVKGRWRTAVVGETQYRRGGPWSEPKTSVSVPIRC